MTAPVLILGATSDMGRAIAHQFAAQGYPIQLAARQVSRLEPDKADLEIRYGVAVSIHEFDVLALETHAAFIQQLPEQPAIVICVVGFMPDQKACEQNLSLALEVMRTNYEGPAVILSLFANLFEQRGFGTLVGISSVAGERGRASNYFYGSAKAGFTAFLSGLRHRLAKSGVQVLTVLPGYVKTRMTEGRKLPPQLTAEPKEVANAIFSAIEKKKDVIYVRSTWRWIMAVIRWIPEPLFKRLLL
ncbi:oxidoreductase short-chain dehydrogenase/reductase family [Thermosynechococcus sp. NK55a]|jgi:short-subunit dehydrogenase|uniref:SDR family oxidoreductase n=1 Tax=unclassified Thermosynechococcus TaxID=2622553 RepID=UPI0003D7F7B3|nr:MULTISPECIES: SDR family oxidoreductase [unclassified Thermosynechococcus]AHB88798.1 oxidoreductase short-chain dehydrogenase/reductase family [Thermosynechococcus sp. NK55a]RMH66269.1 MAG: SDR family oxidoreductase [Cyanobacteria bacterium J003]HIK24021.1 SDR family oxidoreductase [Thermosynechococcus sp. M3746_W2019_013]